MRKIRFRGFCPDLDRWLYGDLLQCGSRLVDHYTKIVPVLAIVEEDGTAKEIDPKSLGQLTWQVDCNGKEIYEGDLLYCPIGRLPEERGCHCTSDMNLDYYESRGKHRFQKRFK